MIDEKRKAAVRRLIEELSDLEVRELCLEALRQSRRNRRAQGLSVESTFSMHGDVGRHVIPLLAARKGEPEPNMNDSPKEVFIECPGEPWMAGVVEFVDWFTRAGLGFPLSAGTYQYPVNIRLTRAGERLLDAPADHPLLPGAISRTCARCANLPDDVAGLLADAHACIDHGLLRPSISVLGVAYELALDAVVDALIAKSILGGEHPVKRGGLAVLTVV